MFSLKCVDGQLGFEASNATTDDLMNELCYGVAYALARISSNTGIAPEQLAAGLMYNLPEAQRSIVGQDAIKTKEEMSNAIQRN